MISHIQSKPFLSLGPLLVSTVLTLGCAGDDASPGGAAPCNPATDACTLHHDFGNYTMKAGSELDGVCMSWTLDNDDELWVNAVRTENDGMFHHSNWIFVPETSFKEPDGHWKCSDGNFTEIAAAVLGGVLYAQSTQTLAEEQRFLPGAALRIPPRARIIANTHLLNTTSDATETEIRVALDTIPADQVATRLLPFRLNYNDLKIAAHGKTRFSGNCDIKTTYTKSVGDPFELKLHWVLPHYHAMGDYFSLKLAGGDRHDELLVELDGVYGEPLGHLFDEPFDLAASGAHGLTFTCGYTNHSEVEVGWGIGDQEMCVMLGFAETGMLFDGWVDTSDTLETDADGVAHGSGPCKVIGVSK